MSYLSKKRGRLRIKLIGVRVKLNFQAIEMYSKLEMTLL